MASINDFKLINAKAHKCFELLLNNFNNNAVTEKTKILTEIEKNRLGPVDNYVRLKIVAAK